MRRAPLSDPPDVAIHTRVSVLVSVTKCVRVRELCAVTRSPCHAARRRKPIIGGIIADKHINMSASELVPSRASWTALSNQPSGGSVHIPLILLLSVLHGLSPVFSACYPGSRATRPDCSA